MWGPRLSLLHLSCCPSGPRAVPANRLQTRSHSFQYLSQRHTKCCSLLDHHSGLMLNGSAFLRLTDCLQLPQGAFLERSPDTAVSVASLSQSKGTLSENKLDSLRQRNGQYLSMTTPLPFHFPSCGALSLHTCSLFLLSPRKCFTHPLPPYSSQPCQ